MDKTLFDNLVPVVVHQAMAAFDVRKKEIVNREITRLKEATNLANAAMASMNLPAAIEITGKNNELPQVSLYFIMIKFVHTGHSHMTSQPK